MAKRKPKPKGVVVSPTQDRLPQNVTPLSKHPQRNQVGSYTSAQTRPPMFDLQDFICNENPYTAGSDIDMTLDEDYKAYTTIWDGWKDRPPQFIYWFFDGQDGPQHLLRVSKAMRIPYTYVNADNETVTEYLLIGYEGAGGY